MKSTIQKLRVEESKRSSNLEREISLLKQKLSQKASSAPLSSSSSWSSSSSSPSVNEDQHEPQHRSVGDDDDSNVEKQALLQEIEVLKNQIDELVSSEAVEIGGLKNTIAILRKNENKTIQNLELQISALKNQLMMGKGDDGSGDENYKSYKVPSMSIHDRYEDLCAENKRLRGALIEKCSFDTNELELVKSNSTTSSTSMLTSDSGKVDPLSPTDKTVGEVQKKSIATSSDDQNETMRHLQKKLSEKDELIKRLQDQLSKVTKNEDSDNKDTASRNTEASKKSIGKAKNPNRLSIHIDADKQTSQTTDTLKITRPPLGALKINKSNEMSDDLNQKLRKKISELSNEVNKWRIKATLLVEKKNKTRLLSKENSDLKKKVKILKEKLKSFEGYESPISSPMPQLSKDNSRCVV